MIKRARGLILLGVLTLIVSVVVAFPARVAYQMAASPLLTMGGIEGSIWSGKAREADAAGFYIRDLSWKLQPLQLLTGNAIFHVTANPVAGFVDGNVGISFGGTVQLSDITGSIATHRLERPFRLQGVAGDAHFRLDRVEVRAGRLVALDGTVEFPDLRIPAVGQNSLGSFKADFFTQNNGVAASIEDTDGVVDVAGSLQIDRDGAYVLTGVLAEKPQTPDNLRQQLAYLPKNDRDQQEIRVEGILPLLWN